jgi:type II secretory pathway component PulM
MNSLQQQINVTLGKIKPYYEKAEYKFKALSYREKIIVVSMAIFIALYIVLTSIHAIVKYRYSLQNQVNNLKVISVSVDQIANKYKVLKNVQPNSTNKIDINNLKQEIKTALQVNSVDVDVQDNQIIISGSMVSFEKVILLLEQLKKSYNVFPEKASFIKAKSGMVSFSFTIWMNN